MICPMACSYCPQQAAEQAYHGPRLMSLATFMAALYHAPADIPVSFAGLAEPYLNNHCTRMIEIVHARGQRVYVYTTGCGMSDADVQALIEMQPYRLVFHAPDAEGDMKLNVTPDYVERMTRLHDRVKSFQMLCFGSLPRSLSHMEGKMRHNGLHTRAGNVVHMTTPKQKHGPLRCGPAPDLKNNVLLPSGELLVCCMDYSIRHVIGNLAEESWDAIHAGAKKAAFAELMRSGDCLCRTCEFAEAAA